MKAVKSPRMGILVYRFVKDIFPMVDKELDRWRTMAKNSPDETLAKQALDSLLHKRFHCQGGSIYALYPGAEIQSVVEFVVAYQTISDYLDNLVDSVSVENEEAFRQLHLAMTEALEPESKISDYYRYYPYKDDGGYLLKLVETCRKNMAKLPAYHCVREEMLRLADFYSHLQTYKHLSLAEREGKMLGWINSYLEKYPAVTAWEFAAATGSTLGIFCLFAVAFSQDLTQQDVKQIVNAYFPWICALHIMLDYLIDLPEDVATAQLNFIQYYENEKIISKRLKAILTQCYKWANDLAYPQFHQTVIQGLLAMYLSDPKTKDDKVKQSAEQLLSAGGLTAKMLYFVCRILRQHHIL